MEEKMEDGIEKEELENKTEGGDLRRGGGEEIE